MGKARRSTDEQRVDMLLMLQEADRIQSDIMYGCKLPHQRLVKHLQHLVERGATVWNETTGMYCLTPTGEDAIRHYKAFKELI